MPYNPVDNLDFIGLSWTSLAVIGLRSEKPSRLRFHAPISIWWIVDRYSEESFSELQNPKRAPAYFSNRAARRGLSPSPAGGRKRRERRPLVSAPYCDGPGTSVSAVVDRDWRV